MSKKIKEFPVKPNHDDRKYKSTLEFYSVNYEGVDKAIDDIENCKYVSFRQIVFFKLSKRSLSKLLRDGIASELSNILDIIKYEMENDDANFMVVQNGKSTEGYYIQTFIDRVV
jgi:hypothetical protein